MFSYLWCIFSKCFIDKTLNQFFFKGSALLFKIVSYEVELYSVCLDILLENSNRFFLSIESLCIYSFSRVLLDPCCSRSSSFCLIWTGFHFWRIQACILGWRNEHHLLFSILVCSHLTCERRESNTRWAKSLLSLRDPWEPSTSVAFSSYTHAFPLHSFFFRNRWMMMEASLLFLGISTVVCDWYLGKNRKWGWVILHTPTHSFTLRYPLAHTQRNVCKGIDQTSWHLGACV